MQTSFPFLFYLLLAPLAVYATVLPSFLVTIQYSICDAGSAAAVKWLDPSAPAGSTYTIRLLRGEDQNNPDYSDVITQSAVDTFYWDISDDLTCSDYYLQVVRNSNSIYFGLSSDFSISSSVPGTNC
ncbi:hypothetical protein V8B97DRAFT_2068247 [Scleroderma yunnanense]